MLIWRDGERVGFVSAGCLEDEIAAVAEAVIDSGISQLLHFDTRRRFGCNGSIEVFVERADPTFLKALSTNLDARRSCIASTIFEGNEVTGSALAASRGTGMGELLQRIEPPIQLIVIGDGADADALRKQANMLGWEFAGLFSIADWAQKIDERTAVVIATHNYGRDCAALKYVLPLGLRYVGAIGPRRRRDELLIDVLDSGAKLEPQLFAPAGLHLNAESPEEIALSIVAEIQAVFAGGSVQHLRDWRSAIHAANRTDARRHSASKCAAIPAR